MSEYSPTSKATKTASAVLDVLGITSNFLPLKPEGIERARRLLFQMTKTTLLPPRHQTLRPIFVVGEFDDDRIKGLCLSKFKVGVDSVCNCESLRGPLDIEGEGEIAIVVDRIIVGVASHAGKWHVPELLPHFKLASAEWRVRYGNVWRIWQH